MTGNGGKSGHWSITPPMSAKKPCRMLHGEALMRSRFWVSRPDTSYDVVAFEMPSACNRHCSCSFLKSSTDCQANRHCSAASAVIISGNRSTTIIQRPLFLKKPMRPDFSPGWFRKGAYQLPRNMVMRQDQNISRSSWSVGTGSPPTSQLRCSRC